MRRRTRQLIAVATVLVSVAACADDESDLRATTEDTSLSDDRAGGDAAGDDTTGSSGADGSPPDTEASGTGAGAQVGLDGPQAVQPGVAATLAPGPPPEPGAPLPPDDPARDWALAYVGATEGSAAQLPPVRIGWVNQESLFPDATIGARAAVAFANTELGGARGRPVELVACSVVIAADGASCAAQLAGDPSVVAVLTGALAAGNAELYGGFAESGAVLVGSAVTATDFTSPTARTLTVGPLGVIEGLARFAATGFDAPPTKVAVVHTLGNAGTLTAEKTVRPVLDAFGIEMVAVPLPERSDAAAVQQRLTDAGALDAEVFVVFLSTRNCVSLTEAIGALGIDPEVVATDLCAGDAMAEHLASLGVGGVLPLGWHVGGHGYNVFDPDGRSGMQAYRAKLQQYGVGFLPPAALEAAAAAAAATTTTTGADPATTVAVPVLPEVPFAGYAGPAFANVLTVLRAVHAVVPPTLADPASQPAPGAPAVRAALESFTGPMMMQAGELECGREQYPAVCGQFVGIQQFLGTRWRRVADGTNGRAIDLRVPLPLPPAAGESTTSTAAPSTTQAP